MCIECCTATRDFVVSPGGRGQGVKSLRVRRRHVQRVFAGDATDEWTGVCWRMRRATGREVVGCVWLVQKRCVLLCVRICSPVLNAFRTKVAS